MNARGLEVCVGQEAENKGWLLSQAWQHVTGLSHALATGQVHATGHTQLRTERWPRVRNQAAGEGGPLPGLIPAQQRAKSGIRTSAFGNHQWDKGPRPWPSMATHLTMGRQPEVACLLISDGDTRE